MPKKKNPESQAEQSERFLRTVEELARDGEISPTEAQEDFERLMDNVKMPKKQ
jgi:hypothetical protein